MELPGNRWPLEENGDGVSDEIEFIEGDSFVGDGSETAGDCTESLT